MSDEEPLSAVKLDTFTSSVLDGCLKLLDALSDTVYRTCDLIVTCIQRNGPEWRDQTLRHLASQVRLGDSWASELGWLGGTHTVLRSSSRDASPPT